MHRKGFVLIATLGTIVFFSILGSSLLLRGISQSQLSTKALRQSGALHMADPGLDQAALNMRTLDVTDDVGSVAFPTGNLSILSTDLIAGLANYYKVVSRGDSQQERRCVEAIIQLTGQSIWQYALFGSTQVNVSGSADTNSFDSRLGPYGGANISHNGNVGTNATTAGGMAVSGGAGILIDGQLAVGPNVADPTSVVTGYNPALITGNPKVISQSTTFPMPSVTIPSGCATDLPPIVNKTRTFLAATGNYCPSGDITINGGDKWTADGTVQIYLAGALTMSGNSVIGVQGDPTKMLILMTPGSSTTVAPGTITGSTEFYGTLYGPDSTIDIQGNAEIYGSIVAKTVNITGSAAIHYDAALQQDNRITNLFTTTRRAWREISCP